MTFIIILLILSGLALIFAGIEKQSVSAYLQKWIA